MRIDFNIQSEPTTRIMVMSADAQLGKLLNILLQDHGFVTSRIEFVQQGIEAIENGSTDILILDEALPGGVGTDILQQIMIQYPEVPVIFLTNDPHSNAAIEAILLGAFSVLAKPVDVSHLSLTLVGAKARKAQQRPTRMSDSSLAPGCALCA